MPTRTRQHFRVHTSLRSHRKTASLYTDNDLLAVWLRLGCLAIERFAARTGDSFTISMHELPAITGKNRTDAALRLLFRLEEVSPMSVECSPDVRRTLEERCANVRRTLRERSPNVLRITIPNLAKKQGLAESKWSPPNTKHQTPNTKHQTPSTKGREEARSAPAPPSRSRPKTPPPEALQQTDVQRLALWAENHDDPGIRKLAPEVQRLVSECLDWHRANGKRRVDWIATARNWISKQAGFDKRDPPRGGPRGGGGVAGTIAAGREAAEYLRQREANR